MNIYDRKVLNCGILIMGGMLLQLSGYNNPEALVPFRLFWISLGVAIQLQFTALGIYYICKGWGHTKREFDELFNHHIKGA